MKRYIVVISIFMSLIFSKDIYAETISSFTIEELHEVQTDYSEITELNQSIINGINDMRSYEQLEPLPKDFSIDFQTAKKIYVDTDIFSVDTVSKDKIMENLNNSTYMWMILVSVDSITYQVNIAKGLPLNESVAYLLSEQEIKNIKDNEGKWTISGIEALKNKDIDYEKIINTNIKNVQLNENVDVVLCGGLEHINQPVALVMNEEKAEYLIPLYDLKVEGTEEQIENIKPKTASSKDDIYVYEKIRDAANEMNNHKNTVGTSGYIILNSTKSKENYDVFALLLIVVGIVSLSILYFIRKKLVKQ